MGTLPKANKDLGQHFLKDKKVIDGITEDFKDVCDIIVEIGPGPAILSKNLAAIGKPFYVIEMDKRFIEQLGPIIPQDNIFFEDALNFDWINFVKEKGLEDKKIWLVSNLPYNVSSPLFISFLQIPQIKFMTLMFQKEVGEKTYLRQNEKNQMSSLLSLSLNYFNPKLLLKVLPGAFNPPPKVDSVVVSYTRLESPIISIKDFAKFESFLRTLFQFRRKQIGSVLKTLVPSEKKEDFYKMANIESTIRAEALNIQQVYDLYDSYLKIK